jgi:uncharacterized protein YdbL (DUF1318 family)
MKNLAIFVSLAAIAAPAAAQPATIGDAVQAGTVGERYDGYMAAVAAVPPQLQRQLAAVNLRRRNLYIDLAGRRRVTPDLVGMATACQLLSQLSAGDAYMLSDRIWRRRADGETVPLPAYCR